LSGSALAGSDDATPLTVQFPDSSRRILTVSAAEAVILRSRGKAVPPHWYERLFNWTTNNIRKIAVAGIALWFTAVVIPAVVQQWADRQKELELKTSLVTGISDAVADATSTGRLLKRGLTPEAAVQRAAADRLSLYELQGASTGSTPLRWGQGWDWL
jgi:hypothetical protein